MTHFRSMKYSSRNLIEPGVILPLPFPVKIIVEYCPGGVCVDSAPMIYAKDPEAAADEIVRTKGWDRLPGHTSSDVWVDGGL